MKAREAGSAIGRRRLTRGGVMLDRSGRLYVNRYREEFSDSGGQRRIRRARMRLGAFPSLAQAEAQLDRYIALLEPESLQPGIEVTMQEYCALFDRKRISVRSRQTQRTHRGTIARYILPALGRRRLATVDVGAIEELVAGMHERQLSRATINAARKLTIQILRHARKAGYAAHAITAADAPLPSERKVAALQRYFSAAEIDAILAASTGSRRLMWAVSAYAGLRISEVLGLERQHIDLGQGLVLVRQGAVDGTLGPVKGAKPRDVPMLPELREAFEAYEPPGAVPSGLLFQSRRGTPLRDCDVRRRWLSPLLKTLKLPPAGCHAFRRFCAQHLDAIGVSPSGIQKFLGHSSLKITETYLRRASRDLNDQVRNAVQRRSQTATKPIERDGTGAET
jgi:integrase